jgi:hypothetical protein
MATIKIEGVKSYTSKGKVYAYHRASGTRILKPYGSDEFFAELAEVKRRCEGKQPTETPGTWGALVIQYRAERLPQLGDRTRQTTKRFSTG